ncbi:MAG: hypothetical protein AAFQ68_05350 [Bacteroidota bacterium]
MMKEKLMDYLASEAYQTAPESIEDFLQANPECRPEWEEIRLGWELLGDGPSVPTMPNRFDELSVPRSGEKREKAKTITLQLPRWSIAAGWVILGLLAGLLWPRSNHQEAIALLSEELQQTRLTMQVLYLQSPDASERMYAASLSQELPITDFTKEAWLLALEEDPSLSVRMAALDVLTREAIGPSLRQRLIESMEYQDSPMLRIEMAELAKNQNWTDALGQVRNWLKDELSPPPLQKALQEVINHLEQSNKS